MFFGPRFERFTTDFDTEGVGVLLIVLAALVVGDSLPSEASWATLRYLLLANGGPFQYTGHHREDLAWAGRLDQVIMNASTDRLAHGLGFLGLGHHDDPDVRVRPAQRLQHL